MGNFLTLGSQKHPCEIHLCVAIVKYRTKLKIPRKGVCTSYLSLLKPGQTVRYLLDNILM